MMRFIDKRAILAAGIAFLVLSAGNGDEDLPDEELVKMLAKLNISRYRTHRTYRICFIHP